MLQNPTMRICSSFTQPRARATGKMARWSVQLFEIGARSRERRRPSGNHHSPSLFLPLAARSFPKEIEVWDKAGNVARKVASQPLQERVSLTGVQTGSAFHHVEAIRPRHTPLGRSVGQGQSPQRSALLLAIASSLSRRRFTANPRRSSKPSSASREWNSSKTEYGPDRRFQRQKRWQRTFLVDLDKPSASKLIWARNNQDR